MSSMTVGWVLMPVKPEKARWELRLFDKNRPITHYLFLILFYIIQQYLFNFILFLLY